MCFQLYVLVKMCLYAVVGDANQVPRTAFSTYEQTEIYKCFLEVICIDPTYNTNRGK